MSENLKLKVEGMDCSGCALDVETVLHRMDGIISARASSYEETITVEYDPKGIDEKQILSAITRMNLKPVKV